MVPEVFLDFSPHERAARESREAVNKSFETATLAFSVHRFATLSQLSHVEKNQEKRKIKENLWNQGTKIFLLQFGLFTWLSLVLVTSRIQTRHRTSIQAAY